MADIIDIEEAAAMRALREWRCLNCDLVHHGRVSRGERWRWCPDCGSSSRRTHKITISGEEAEFRDSKLKEVVSDIMAAFP